MKVLWKRNWIATLVMVNLLLASFLVAAPVTNAGFVGSTVMSQNICFEGQLSPGTVLQPLSIPDFDPTILMRQSLLIPEFCT
jgi:hypothetical protein